MRLYCSFRKGSSAGQSGSSRVAMGKGLEGKGRRSNKGPDNCCHDGFRALGEPSATPGFNQLRDTD